jgi:hypothetical protein
MTYFATSKKSKLMSALSILALSAALVGTTAYVMSVDIVTPAYAAEDGEDGGQKGPHAGSGDGDSGNSGKEGHGGQSTGAQGSGQGGPGEDSEGAGPRANQDSSNAGAGGPVWANEGIPEVEIGRLNVARSPAHVLDRALTEALAELSGDAVEFYNLSLSDMIAELSLNWDDTVIIDSPLQSLALFQAYLEGDSPLASSGVTNNVDTILAALLGVASDKTVTISTDTVIAVTTILGVPMSAADAADLAANAEAIRIAVLAGHG